MDENHKELFKRHRERWLSVRQFAYLSLFAVATGTCVLMILFSPIFRAEAVPASRESLESNKDRVDLYLAFDLSRSVNQTDYPKIEKQLRTLVRPEIGDRISCIGFGSITNPEVVPIASEQGNCADMRPRLKDRDLFFQSTRFGHLFQNLHSAIYSERTNGAPSGTFSRHDVVVVVSDGVPDDDHQNYRCPDDARRGGNSPFIDDTIAGTDQRPGPVTELLNDNYKNPERMSIILLLAGNKRPRCVPDIEGAWRDAIKDLRFSIVRYSEDAIPAIATQIGRARVIYLRPWTQLDDAQRREFDAKSRFVGNFDVWSHFRPDRVTLASASLFDRKGRVASLSVTYDCSVDSGPQEIVTKPPAADQMEGSEVTIRPCFKFVDWDRVPPLARNEAYRLHLNIDDKRIEAQDLDIIPAAASTRRDAFKGRISWMGIICGSLLLFLLGIHFSAIAIDVEKYEDFGERLQMICAFCIIERFKYWLLFFVLITLGLLVAVSCLCDPYSAFVFPALVVLSWAIYEWRWKPAKWKVLCFIAIEVALFPLIEVLIFLSAKSL